MIFDRDGNITFVHQEKVSLQEFLANLEKAYPKLKNDHLVLNLFSFDQLSEEALLEFLPLSDRHRGLGKSFVLVSEATSYEEVPEEISLVPSLQEARDLIEMEDIERDLDL